MKCPHCLTKIYSELRPGPIGIEKRGEWNSLSQQCPECQKLIIYLTLNWRNKNSTEPFLVYPKTIARQVLSPEIPEEFTKDYKESCATLFDSPKASAALSRRCLQHLIREMEGIKKPNLSQEIDELINSRNLPSYLAEGIDAIRNVGNFAAHPIKSTNTGEIVEVEPGEAEWLLDLLEGLFDFYFVQPASLQKKKDALNKKLTDAGKPPMK